MAERKKSALTVKKLSWLRALLAGMLMIERRYLAKIKNSAWLRYVMHGDLFSFRRKPLARGLAVGMFWAMMPMPFQMVPATLFCWLGFANLPIALVCVWLSNPFTYLPIFYVEYMVGAMLFYSERETAISFAEFSSRYADIAHSLGDVYFIVLKGALVLGVLAAAAGYIAATPLSYYMKKIARRRSDAHPR